MNRRLRETLEKLSSCGLIEGFYLTGGTALALQYEHRISEDLDFFCLPELSEERFPYHRLISGLARIGKVVDQSRGTVVAVVDGIVVSFFSYPYPLLEPFTLLEVALSVPKVAVASDKDIACSKAVAIAQRGLKKDFFDLHFLLCKNSWNLKELIDFCCEKYGFDRNYIAFLVKSLTYFEDAENDLVYIREGVALPEADWDRIKAFFLEQVRLMYL